MTKIGLFFGTQTGNTETIAETIQKVFGGDSVVTLHNVADTEAADLEDYEYLIIGFTQLKRFGV